MLNLKISIRCKPNISVLFKSPKILTTKVGRGFWRQETRYPKILTGAKPKISIRCKPKFFVLFKSPKILTSTSRAWVFWRQKHGSYEIPQDFDRPVKPKISIRCKPNIFVLFKNHKILKSHTGNGFLVSKTWFLRNTPRFRQVLKMKF